MRVTSVSAALNWAFGVLVVLLVVVGGTGVVGLVAAGEARGREVAVEELRDANSAMLLAMTSAETGVRGYRLSHDRAFLAPYTMGREDFPVQSLAALALAKDEAQQGLVEQQRAIAQHWFRVYGEPVSAMPPGQVEVPPDLTLRNKVLFDQLRAANTELEALVDADAAEAQARESLLRQGGLALTAMSLMVALLVGNAAAVRTRRALVDPLSGVVDVLGELAAGREQVRADVGTGPEEVRAVARSLNALADESQRLRAEQEDAARLRRLATEIGRSIRDHLDAEESVAVAISRLGADLGADRVWMRLLEEDESGPVEQQWARHGVAPMPAATELGRAQGEALVRENYALGHAVVLPDVRAVVPLPPSVQDVLVQRAGATAAVLIPVGAGENALGALGIMMASGTREWTEREVALATSVAADLGRALVLAGLYRQQQELVERLQRLDRTKTDFLSTVSHELRTPLTSIAGYVELIRDGEAGDVPPEMGTMLAVVERNAHRLQVLIEDLLTLSRIESGAFRVTRTEVDLADVLEGVAGVLRPSAEGQGLRLETDSAAQRLVVSGDAGQLERALLNLASNAVKFTPAGGTVGLSARAEDGWAVVEVSDTGIGVPSSEQEGLFSRFFRASNATDRAIPGTGLGLTIVRSIVEHHRGELGMRSTEGVGTTVTVRLPLSGADPSAGGHAPTAGEAADEVAEVPA